MIVGIGKGHVSLHQFNIVQPVVHTLIIGFKYQRGIIFSRWHGKDQLIFGSGSCDLNILDVADFVIGCARLAQIDCQAAVVTVGTQQAEL